MGSLIGLTQEYPHAHHPRARHPVRRFYQLHPKVVAEIRSKATAHGLTPRYLILAAVAAYPDRPDPAPRSLADLGAEAPHTQGKPLFLRLTAVEKAAITDKAEACGLTQRVLIVRAVRAYPEKLVVPVTVDA